MSSRTASKLALLVGTALFLSACAATQEAEENIKRTHESAMEVFERSAYPRGVLSETPLRRASGKWLGSRGQLLEKGVPLPSRLDQVTFVTYMPMSLDQIASELSEITSVPFQIEDGTLESIIERKREADDDDDNRPLVRSPGEEMDIFALDLLEVDRQRMDVTWNNKPLSGLLDLIGTRFNVSWRYDGDQVVIYRYETQTFTLHALAIDSDVTMSLAEAGGNAEGSSNGGQESTNTAAVRIWEDIDRDLQAILGDDAIHSISPSTGTITVTAYPQTMRKVAQYLKDQNARLGRQVSLEVKVMTVQLDNSDDYGMDLSGLLDAASNSFGFNYESNMPTNFGEVPQLDIGILRGRLAGSSALVTALSQLGSVSIENDTRVMALNNQATPINVTRSISYLESVSSVTTDVENTITLEPGTVTTGFRMTVMPRILDSGDVILQYAVNMSDLREMVTFDVGDQKIQLPDVDSRSFMQQAVLRNGQPMIIGGFQQNVSTTRKSGVGDGNFPLLGGRQQAENQKQVVVVMITPQVLDSGRNGFMGMRR